MRRLMEHKAWIPFLLFVFTASAADIACWHWQAHMDAEALRAFDAELERLDAHNLPNGDLDK